VELALEGGEGDVHDRVVERDHEKAERADAQYQQAHAPSVSAALYRWRRLCAYRLGGQVAASEAAPPARRQVGAQGMRPSMAVLTCVPGPLSRSGP